MDISPVASTQLFSPPRESVQGRANGNFSETARLARENADAATRDSPTDPRRIERERAESARRQEAPEQVRGAGIRFEYENSQQVMKVNNSKGVLIYQVPSKGQLALIESNDTERDALVRAFA